MTNKIVVYTAIFDDRDLLQVPIKFKDVTYVCFTDNPSIMSDIWKIVYIPGNQEHPRRQAKIFKICPHLYFPEYTYSLWVDATHIPQVHPEIMIEKYLKHDHMALFNHHKRTCIYEEAKECIKLGLDDPQIIKDQVKKYREAGYPESNGLATCTIMLRKHNEVSIIAAMNRWWSEIQSHSMRDQISFNFVMHIMQLSYFTIDLDVYKNTLFKRHYHLNTSEFYMLIDKYIGMAGIRLKAFSPRLYLFLKTKIFKS